MSKEYQPVHGVWTSRWVFVLAAAGSAVGLGNIWKFPYIAGDYGGGAFVLVYLICIALVGIPIMIAEIGLGRHGGLSPIHPISQLVRDNEVSRKWTGVGFLGALSGFLLLTFYSVVAGWALYYVWEMGSGALDKASPEQVKAAFDGLLASPWVLLGWHTLFMVLTMGVVAHGVEKGLERAVRFLMPSLLVILLILLGYAINSGGFTQGLEFMFTFDFSALGAEGILAAMGQAFFTLSLGLGAIMAYGAYMPRQITTPGGETKHVSIGSTALIIAVLDTAVAMIAGLAIFPVVFANGLEPSQGPGLIFVTLPLAFGQMPLGILFGTLFFLLVSFAALSSSISLGEPLVAWLVENEWSRRAAATLIGVTAWFIGIGTVLSFNVWSDATLGGNTFFDILEFTVSNIMLPLGGLLIAIFAGWIMKEPRIRKELAMQKFGVYMVWRALVRVIAPLAVLAVFLHTLWDTFGG